MVKVAGDPGAAAQADAVVLATMHDADDVLAGSGQQRDRSRGMVVPAADEGGIAGGAAQAAGG